MNKLYEKFQTICNALEKALNATKITFNEPNNQTTPEASDSGSINIAPSKLEKFITLYEKLKTLSDIDTDADERDILLTRGKTLISVTLTTLLKSQLDVDHWDEKLRTLKTRAAQFLSTNNLAIIIDEQNLELFLEKIDALASNEILTENPVVVRSKVYPSVIHYAASRGWIEGVDAFIRLTQRMPERSFWEDLAMTAIEYQKNHLVKCLLSRKLIDLSIIKNYISDQDTFFHNQLKLAATGELKERFLKEMDTFITSITDSPSEREELYSFCKETKTATYRKWLPAALGSTHSAELFKAKAELAAATANPGDFSSSKPTQA